jgi:hypothetical protein
MLSLSKHAVEHWPHPSSFDKLRMLRMLAQRSPRGVLRGGVERAWRGRAPKHPGPAALDFSSQPLDRCLRIGLVFQFPCCSPQGLPDTVVIRAAINLAHVTTPRADGAIRHAIEKIHSKLCSAAWALGLPVYSNSNHRSLTVCFHRRTPPVRSAVPARRLSRRAYQAAASCINSSGMSKLA